jgi:hypothetical protein
MPLLSAAMANDKQVTMHLIWGVLLGVVVLLVLPIIVSVEVCQHTQS